VIRIRIQAITRGALTIALVCIFFTVFKGVTNIFNALLVPLVLYGNLLDLRREERYAILFALVFLCAIFFKIQVIFTIFYCIIALLLLFIQRGKWSFPFGVILLTLGLSMSFWIAIEATDALFLTHMGDIMQYALHGNRLAYAGLLVFEGGFVGTGLLFAAKMLQKRLDRFTK
jgi:hypothetical protein